MKIDFSMFFALSSGFQMLSMKVSYVPGKIYR